MITKTGHMIYFITPHDIVISFFFSVLQYGFVTMFVAAFPLAPLSAFVTNLLELRVDAVKMVKHYRRPVAMRVSGIGVWYEILSTITIVSTKIFVMIMFYYRCLMMPALDISK